jgi:hypothetical protein
MIQSTEARSWSRAAWPLALVLLAAALLSLAASRPAGAQGAGAGRWEYNVFRVDPADYADKADWREILARNNGDGLRAEPDFHQHILRHLGEERWELVQMERVRPSLVYLYLKRPAR